MYARMTQVSMHSCSDGQMGEWIYEYKYRYACTVCSYRYITLNFIKHIDDMTIEYN